MGKSEREPAAPGRRWRRGGRYGVWWRGRARRVAAAVCVAAAVWAGIAAARPDPPEQVPVVVSADEIEVGALIASDSVEVIRVPVQSVPTGALTEVEEVTGRRAVGAVRPGEIITDARVASTTPPQGDRAEHAGVIFVPVPDSAVVGALAGGDRVDLIGSDGNSVAQGLTVTGVAPQESPAGVFVAVDPAAAAQIATQVHPMAPGVTVVIRGNG